MDDYFVGSENAPVDAAANGATQPAANGDETMAEISVSLIFFFKLHELINLTVSEISLPRTRA